jgi:hypothetical protein
MPAVQKDVTRLIKTFDLPYSYIGDYVSTLERENARNLSNCSTYDTIDEVQHESVNLGNTIKNAIKRYQMGDELNNQNRIVQEYVYSGLISACSAGNFIKKCRPTHFIMTHGIYVDWGPARLIARSKNIPVVIWGESYLQGHYFFGYTHGKTAMDNRKIPQEYWESQKNVPLSPARLKSLEDYIRKRYVNNISMDLRILSEYSADVEKFKSRYNLVADKPTWAIFTHIFWDNSSDYYPIAYNSFEEWILDTIKTIKDIPDVNWLIKVHPAEVWWDDSEHGARLLIKKNFSQLPDNIKVIPPDETINPLNFYNVIDGGITCVGTVGLELPILGKPVILAGQPYYSEKGFTYDGLTPDIYRQYLKNIKEITTLSAEKRSLAQKYGYYYYMRRQIPIPMTLNNNPKAWVGTLDFNKRKTLIPTQDPFMDFICEELLNESDFIMNDKLVDLKMRMVTE